MLGRQFTASLVLCLLGCGGGAAAPRQPAGAPPTARTVTPAEPGGDAANPHAAALQRLIDEPWGTRRDRDGQLLVPLPDAENWKRVRYWGVEHFVGFRYGDERHAFVAVFVQDSPLERPSTADCVRSFEQWGRPKIKAFDVEFGAFRVHHSRFQTRPMLTLAVEGQLSFGFSRPQFSAAWAAFPVYPKACLISAVVVPWEGQRALADRLRDRFIHEGFAQTRPLTETRPFRKDR